MHLTVPLSPTATPDRRRLDYLAYVHVTGRWPSHLRSAGNAHIRRFLQDGAADGISSPLRLRRETVDEFQLDAHPMVRTATTLRGFGYRLDGTEGPNARRCFDRFRMKRGEHELYVFSNGGIWTENLNMFAPPARPRVRPVPAPAVRHRARPAPPGQAPSIS